MRLFALGLATIPEIVQRFSLHEVRQITSTNEGTQNIRVLPVAKALEYSRSGVESIGGSEGSKFDSITPVIVFGGIGHSECI